MTRINLKSGYYIEIDPLNHTLKQEFQGKDKSGKAKQSIRVCGYFKDLRQAIERYIKLSQLDILDGEAMELQQYVEIVERCNSLLAHGIVREVRR